MQLFATFENSLFLELAIATLEKRGIKQADIYAVPLDNRKKARKLFDTIHQSDGTSLIDLAVILGTAFSVVGVSFGFKMAWGPIWIGLIGAVMGAVIGLVIRLFTEGYLKNRKQLLKGPQSEVILIVECAEPDGEWVENILWEHFARGVAKVI